MTKKGIILVAGALGFAIAAGLFASQSLYKPVAVEAERSPMRVEEALKSYETGKVLSSHTIGTDFLLVAHQEDGLSNRFDMHDLKSGRMDELPTGAELTALEEIIDENHIVLRASGKNGESAYTAFPYWMHFFRNIKAVEGEPAFYVQKEERYFELNTPLAAGSKPICQLKTIECGVTGIAFVFTPVVGQEAAFNAGFTDIPPTEISYDAAKQILCVAFKGISVDAGGLTEVRSGEERYGYIEDISLGQKDQELIVKLTLKTDELLYLPSISRVGPYEGSTEDVTVLGIAFKQQPQ